jgi:hypothetical protein
MRANLLNGASFLPFFAASSENGASATAVPASDRKVTKTHNRPSKAGLDIARAGLREMVEGEKKQNVSGVQRIAGGLLRADAGDEFPNMGEGKDKKRFRVKDYNTQDTTKREAMLTLVANACGVVRPEKGKGSDWSRGSANDKEYTERYNAYKRERVMIDRGLYLSAILASLGYAWKDYNAAKGYFDVQASHLCTGNMEPYYRKGGKEPTVSLNRGVLSVRDEDSNGKEKPAVIPCSVDQLVRAWEITHPRNKAANKRGRADKNKAKPAVITQPESIVEIVRKLAALWRADAATLKAGDIARFSMIRDTANEALTHILRVKKALPGDKAAPKPTGKTDADTGEAATKDTVATSAA